MRMMKNNNKASQDHACVVLVNKPSRISSAGLSADNVDSVLHSSENWYFNLGPS